jgi:ribosomal protein S21
LKGRSKYIVASSIEVKRKKGESFEAVFRRFSRRLQQSGKVLDVRAGRFFEKAPKKNRVHGSALRRLEMGERREFLLKTGKIKEEDLRAKKHGSR